MIESARREFPGIEFLLADARHFSFPHLFDAIFSNAVLHWITEAEQVIGCVSKSLEPGGRFVAEFGGKGNVARIVNALGAAVRELAHTGGEDSSYNPSISEYTALLEKHGLIPTFATLYDRPTKLEDGEQGLRNWIAMFRGSWFSGVSEDVKEQVFAKVEDKLRDELFKEGSWYADYKRLRIVAYKE